MTSINDRSYLQFSASMFPSLSRASTRTNMHCFPRSFATAASPIVPMQHPSKMEAHIWYILPDEVKSTRLQNQYLNILSPDEKENIMKMDGGELQKRALLARALVRTSISRYLTHCQIDPQALKFKKNMFGKPELDWQNSSEQCLPPLQFNISHTSSLIACGVTLNSSIGIDVEEKTRKIKNDIVAFAKRYFSPNEIEVLSAISDPESQRQEFIKLWTLKVSTVARASMKHQFSTCSCIRDFRRHMLKRWVGASQLILSRLSLFSLTQLLEVHVFLGV